MFRADWSASRAWEIIEKAELIVPMARFLQGHTAMNPAHRVLQPFTPPGLQAMHHVEVGSGRLQHFRKGCELRSGLSGLTSERRMSRRPPVQPSVLVIRDQVWDQELTLQRAA